MNAVARFVRDTLERLAGVFYEGPQPPPRLRDEVLVFRAMHPSASVADWVEFAMQHGEASYRAGFDRGIEWRERDIANKDPHDPDRIADDEANGWTVADDDPVLRAMLERGVDPTDPLAGVPPEDRAEFVDRLGEIMGTHRVVIVTDDTPPDARER